MADAQPERRQLSAVSLRKIDLGVLVTELRRRNTSAVAMDVLFLFTMAFFAHHLLRGMWPALIAAVPIVALLYFGYRSSIAFFVVQVITIVATVAATHAGWIPL